MRRLTILLLLAYPAPAPAKIRPPAPVTAAEPALPVPPIPPDLPPSDGTAAPLPDDALTEPDRPLVSRGVTLSPGLFVPRARELSDGYLGRSGAPSDSERRQKATPGLKLSVPIR